MTDIRRTEIDRLSARPSPGVYIPPLSESGQKGEEWRRFEEESTVSERIAAFKVFTGVDTK